VLVGASLVFLALNPTVMVFLTTQVLRRAADYGLGKPTREMLFTVLNPESKFKSKSLIDTVLHRGSDSIAQGLYLVVAGVGLVSIAWGCALACFILLGITWSLGRAFEVQRKRSTGATAAS
jgi:AAA family ATP:ADP antiporter